MSMDDTVAPKERVNIVYRSATEGMTEDVELPLKILVLGSYTATDDGTPLDERRPVQIDKDNFHAALKAQNVSLDLQVPNHLQSGPQHPQQLAVHLTFEHLNDFSPDALVRKLSPLRELLALREALKALKGPLGNIPEFRKKLQSLLADPEQHRRLLAEFSGDALPAPDPAKGGQGHG